MLTDEELEILIENLLKDDRYTFEIDGFRLPLYFDNLNISDIRNSLIKSTSQKELSYINFISQEIHKYNRDFECTFIKQFPFIIYDRDSWFNCCSEANCINLRDERGRSYINKKLIYTDIYFPRLDRVLEVDYKFTHQCPEYDKARELYLEQKYNFHTTRIMEYNNGDLDYNLRCIAETYNLLNNARLQYRVDYPVYNYEQLLVENFTRNYKDLSRVIEYYKNKLGNQKQYRMNRKELSYLNQDNLIRLKEYFSFLGYKLI